MSTNNIFSPANGNPIMSPSQDIVLGIFYLTYEIPEEPGDGGPQEAPVRRPSFASYDEAVMAYQLGKVGLHQKIYCRVTQGRVSNGLRKPIEPVLPNQRILTSVGRLLLNNRLPKGMPFYNYPLSQKGIGRVISDCHAFMGRANTVDLLDEIKATGFRWSTLAGLSFGVTDLRVPRAKQAILDAAQRMVDRIEKAFSQGAITVLERHNQLIDIWVHALAQVTDEMMKELANDYRGPGGEYLTLGDEGARRYINPIYLMSDSGARGSVDQIRQLAGMRALMSKPSGEIIETPIKSNFREGLSVLEYFSSTHGARKGLADTALKTADSGYLTRKLADVAQNVIVNIHDCGTINGVTKSAIYKGEEVDIPLRESITGRVARDTIRNPVTDQIIVEENDIITREKARAIEDLGLDTVRVRSPLTCESPLGICALCYGVDMSTGKLVEEGMAAGIVAAQSIGEPGTQLTMRTFHTGGVASRAAVENDIKCTQGGTLAFHDVNPVRVPASDGVSERVVALKRNGEVAINDEKGRELERFKVPYGAELLVPEGTKVQARTSLVTWDPHLSPILAEVEGFVRFQDIAEGETARREADRADAKLVIIEHKGEKHPQIVIEDREGRVLDYHYLPAKARVEVGEGQKVGPGTLLARQPRGLISTQDITGGLPRVTEIFEARKPKEPAVMAEMSGTVEIRADKRRGKMTIIIRKGELEKEHHVPQDRQLLVHAGDYVEAGDPLIEGPLIPHDILRIRGEEALENYLLGEIQAVYRMQNVTINDKHLEVILAQMLRKVKVETPGDSGFLPGEIVDRIKFQTERDRLMKSVKVSDPGDTELQIGDIRLKAELAEMNERTEEEGGAPAKGRRPKPPTAKTLLLGITKASLQSESFISAASFQETTKVLTEASISSAEDRLLGLKENVILGHLIPAGTAFKPHLTLQIEHLGEPLPEKVETPAEQLLHEAALAQQADEAAAAEAAEELGEPAAVAAGAEAGDSNSAEASGQAEEATDQSDVETAGLPEAGSSE
ncbi:MAG: DNA-directed RNA polymerase subunit beta', partial [Phycisphaerales bacterium]